MADVQALLASTQVTTAVDVRALLSEEYSSETDEPLGDSFADSAADGGLSGDEDEASGMPSGLKWNETTGVRASAVEELERNVRRERMRDSETIRKLRDDNEALRRAAAAAQSRAAAELRTYRSSVEAVHARSRAELDELRSKQESLHAELPALRQRLAAGKAEFGKLIIEPAQYEALRRRPMEELSVVEDVQLRVHELLVASERKAATVLAAPTSATPFAGQAQLLLRTIIRLYETPIHLLW